MSNEPPNFNAPGQPYGAPPQPGSYPPGQPAGYPGQPGYPGQAPYPGQPGGLASPPPKKRLTWLWVLLGIFGFIVVGIGACSFLVFGAAKAPIDSANAWMALVDNGDFQGAYDAMCQATRDVAPADAVAATLAADFGAGVDDYQINSYNNSNGFVTVDGTVTVAGNTQPVTFEMNDEDGWRVCGYS